MPTNRPLPKHEVVGLLADRDPDIAPVVTSSYVAEKAGVSRPTALSRLREAEETGDVQSAEAGQATVWWLQEDPITAARARQMFTAGELDEDPFDAIGAGDELRASVEDRREEGEPLDDAVRRLLRKGADMSAPAAERRRTARNWAETAAFLMTAFVIFSIPFGGLLSRSLSLPFVEVSVRFVVGATLLGLLGFHAWYQARAAVGRWRETDREGGGDRSPCRPAHRPDRDGSDQRRE